MAMDPSHCELDIDRSFGPWAQECRGGFDFTLLFEETILLLVPACVLILACLLRLPYLRSKSVKVKSSILLPIKLVLWIAYVALQIALTVLWARPSNQGTTVSTAAAALSLIGGFLALGTSYFEHQRTIRPSTILSVFLFVSILFGCARTRTVWLRQTDSSIPIATTISTVTTTLLFAIESIEKRRILIDQTSDEHTSEAIAGIFNRYFFLWLNPLFKQGSTSTLTIDKLDNLDRHLTSNYLARVLSENWKLGAAKSKSLQTVVLRTLQWPLLGVVVPRIAMGALNFAQPFLINDAITLSTEPISQSTNNTGAGLIGAYILVYVGIAITTGQYWHNNYRAITMARGGLISLLYKKLSDLSVTTANATSSLTLMSADIERISNGWQTMHEIWANAIEIAIAIWLLEEQLGAACAIPLGVAIVSIIGLILLTSLVVARQGIWLSAIERRIEATTAMLKSMKGVKMCGLADILMEKIQDLREEELKISAKFRQLLIWNMAFAYLTPIIAPVLTFTVFSVTAANSGGTSTLSTARVFTSLSLFALLADPLASLMVAVVQFAGAVGSFQRIQEFLESEERHDVRINVTRDSGEGSTTTSATIGSLPTGSDQEKLLGRDNTRSDVSSNDIPNAFVVREAAFGWNDEKPTVLSGLNLNIPRGKFVVIVGPVGCGKSTLLKGLLGEVPKSSGTVEISHSEIAYCDQTNWHMNTTISESIIGVSEMDPIWYKTVVRACALEEDLKQLAKGDGTQIGSSGTALSGGQSQRIALARAVYANKRVVFLDDTMSGLDATTEQKVFHNLLGRNGLWRVSNTTVVMVSSSSKRLPHSDLIVALDSNGKIVEQGSFDVLNTRGGYIASFGHGDAEWTTNDGVEASERDTLLPAHKPESIIEELAGKPKSADGDVQIYLYYVGSIGWVPTITFFAIISAYAIFYSFPSIWVQWWSAANAVNPNGNLGYWLGIYAFLAVGALVCLVISVYQMLIHIMPKSGEGLHRDLLHTVLRAPMSFFSSTDIGVTINRFSQDLQLIDMDLPLAALNCCVTLVLVVAQMVIIGVASVYAAISFPICLVVFYYIQKFYLKTSRQMRLLDLEAKSPLYSNFVECLSGLATIRAFGWQNALSEKNMGMLERSQKPFYLFWSIQRWLTLTLDLVVAGVAVLLIVLVVALRGKLSTGAIGVALYNVILFSQNIKLLLQFWTNLETHIGAVARIKNFTEETEPEDLPSEKRHPPETWPSRGEIEFKNVFASYKSSNLVLKDISLTIKAGSKVAICGRTGSGKSSLCTSIFRMLDVCAGSILVDGLNLSAMPRQTIRSRIIGVPQDSMLLPGNVRFNVDPAESAVDETLIEALKSVELWDIVEEKGGLDAGIDDVFLTHGQKQLFCLARSMVRSSTVVILDEATSSVDGKTDALMQRVIRQKFANHTIIAVAHKLETVLDFDQIVLLEAGCIKEMGPPHELLANTESEFSKLYRDFSSKKITEGSVETLSEA